jgi:hypothetical protein
MIAKHLGVWHGVQLAGEKAPTLFKTLWKWLEEGKKLNEWLKKIEINMFLNWCLF